MEDGALLGIRFALYASLMSLFGLAVFALVVLDPGDREEHWLAVRRSPLAGLALVALVVSVLGFAIVCAAMAGTAVKAVDHATVQMILSETTVGTAFIVRTGALVVASLGAVMLPGRARLTVIAVMSSASLASLAWNGHGASGEGTAGTILLGADLIHLLAAGTWIGALAAFALTFGWRKSTLSVDERQIAHRALDRFALVGTIVVVLLVATGIINGWMLVGPANIWTLPMSLYGQLLLAKLVLFAAMLGLAALNRFRLTPALARTFKGKDAAPSVRALRRSLTVEAGAGAAILGLVAWLGTLAPPAS